MPAPPRKRFHGASDRMLFEPRERISLGFPGTENGRVSQNSASLDIRVRLCGCHTPDSFSGQQHNALPSKRPHEQFKHFKEKRHHHSEPERKPHSRHSVSRLSQIRRCIKRVLSAPHVHAPIHIHIHNIFIFIVYVVTLLT